MNDLLKEILKMASVLDTKGIKVVGTNDSLAMSAVDESKDLVAYINPKVTIPEFEGRFGIPHLKMLENLLSYEGYRENVPKIDRFSRKVTWKVKSEDYSEDMEVPRQMNFRDKRGGKGVFFFSHGEGILGSELPQIPFEIELEPDRDRLKEFAKLSSIFATPECKTFRVLLEDHVLRFAFGTEGATTHHGEMIFAEEVRGVLPSNLCWDANRFNMVVKAIGDRPFKLGVSNKSVMRFMFETSLARYQYWLRGVKL